MPRPPKCRRISFEPDVAYFKPAGVPVRELMEVVLSLDEMEAVRLADLEGLYQEDAASKMNVSRQTFANILLSAHRKIAETLVFGHALRIEGGNVEVKGEQFVCPFCRHVWDIPSGSGSPCKCPRCKAENVCPAAQGEERARRKSCRLKEGCCRKNKKEEEK